MIKIMPEPMPQQSIEQIRNSGEACINGAVHKIRNMGGFDFILLRTGREVIQVVWNRESLGEPSCAEGDYVRLCGSVVPEPRARLGFEVHGRSIEVKSAAAGGMPVTINKNKMNLHMDNHLKYRPLVLRNPRERAVFKMQEGVCRGFREFLTSQGFTEIHSPKITAAGAEGGANIFKLDYFDKQAYLSQSPQLYKQAMVPVFERVFEIGPVFRAEPHDTSRHLNEYTSMDLEMGFIDDHTDVMRMETAMLRYIFSLLSDEYAQELAELSVELPDASAIPSVKFMEAKELIEREFGRPARTYQDFEPEEEKLLGKWAQQNHGTPLVFVTHYPHDARPFYTMDDPADPGYTRSFDLLLGGLEITSGAQRIHDYGMQTEKMRRMGLDPDDFESYLMAHRYGMPPHGGLGLGLERLTMQLAGIENVRYVCLFPRDINHITP